MARTPHQVTEPTRVLLIDDEPVMRRGLHLLLERCSRLEVCGEASTRPEVSAQVRALRANLALVDLRHHTDLQVIRNLHENCPDLKILVFSVHQETPMIAQAFEAGANGYVTRPEGTQKLLEAIQIVIAGGDYGRKQLEAPAS